MPRPQQPPTPASSTEIKSKDGSQFSGVQMSFELPPPAVTATETRAFSNTSSISSHQANSHSPTSPAIPVSEVVKTRRRPSIAQKSNQDTFALPPPPTRSRKIIQMKPKGPVEDVTEVPSEAPKNVSTKASATPKKKQPSSTSVAGRKIARKTAHSLIERRRRSKMNEEFGVLKDMIPACTGEMHKLAILQASIDYVRYLEDCVTKLKAENTRTNPSSTEPLIPPPPARKESQSTPHPYTPQEEDKDTEMGDSSEGISPTYTTPLPSMRPSASPALIPQDSRRRQDSYSSVSKDHRQYSFSGSATTSPAPGPAVYDYARSMAPQRDLDQEATAALLMLNTERRGTLSGRGGMSVRDLLS
ncbi:hypothetical protein HYALB_00012168, partial [Hymenoscyphus albidus]